MTATVSAIYGNDVHGSERITVKNVVFDSSYPTGGLPLTAAQLELGKVNHTVSVVRTAGTGAVTAVHYDKANSKLLAFTASAEVGNGVDLSAVTAQVTAWGY